MKLFQHLDDEADDIRRERLRAYQNRRRHWCRDCMGATGGPCTENDPEPEEDEE